MTEKRKFPTRIVDFALDRNLSKEWIAEYAKEKDITYEELINEADLSFKSSIKCLFSKEIPKIPYPSFSREFWFHYVNFFLDTMFHNIMEERSKIDKKDKENG